MAGACIRRIWLPGLLAVLLLAGEAAASNGQAGDAAAVTLASATPPYAWTIETANETAGAGFYTSIALDSASNPYISYVNEFDGAMYVASRINSTWSSEPVAGSGILGDTNVVVGPSHTVEISFYNANTGWVMYGVKEQSGWHFLPVAQGYVEGYNRLALTPAGQPAIVYTSFEGKLRYATWNGTAWSIETADNQTITSRYEDLAFDPLGRPHVSYYGGGVLLHAVRTVSGWFREVVDPTEQAGWFSRIRIDSHGWAHIAYYASANTSLMYATDGPSGWTRSLIDSANDSGYDLSFVLDSLDRPQIAYYQRLTESLRYAIGIGQGWVRETVDTDGVVGWYTGIATDAGGIPHISYFDWTDSSLRYAVGTIALQVRSTRASQLTPTSAALQGELVALGNNSEALVGFEFRPTESANWTYENATTLQRAGTFAVTLTNLTTDAVYEFRAIAAAGSERSTGATVSFRLTLPPPPTPDLVLPAVLTGSAILAGIAIVLLLRRRRRPKVPESKPISYVAR